jgi:hypothetical protein
LPILRVYVEFSVQRQKAEPPGYMLFHGPKSAKGYGIRKAVGGFRASCR